MALFNRKKKDTAGEVTKVFLNELGGLKDALYIPAAGKDSEAQVSCLETNATFCGKVELMSVRVTRDGERIRDFPALDRLLQLAPNPTMTAAVFWERVAYYYFKYNNSFIYIEKDVRGDIKALWSIDPTMVEVAHVGATGETVLKFNINGRTVQCLDSEIVHLARMVTKSMLFGDKASPAIQNLISLINLNYKGVENAIKTSGLIRFIGKVSSPVDEEKKVEWAKKFTEQYLQAGSGVGVIYSDGKANYEPVTNPQQYTAKYTDVNNWNSAIYKYYGCPEKVIAGEATENEMVSYYERTIEPFFIRVSQELTRKLFTAREIEFGNQIQYRDKKLLYMSMGTKLQIFNAARELGAFTLGTLGDLLGLDVAEGKRDQVVVSQNYIESTQEPAEGSQEPVESSQGAGEAS